MDELKSKIDELVEINKKFAEEINKATEEFTNSINRIIETLNYGES